MQTYIKQFSCKQEIMTFEKMTQVTTQAATKAAKTVVMTVREAETPTDNVRQIETAPRIDGPTLT